MGKGWSPNHGPKWLVSNFFRNTETLLDETHMQTAKRILITATTYHHLPTSFFETDHTNPSKKVKKIYGQKLSPCSCQNKILRFMALFFLLIDPRF